jgi:hypothetical protein
MPSRRHVLTALASLVGAGCLDAGGPAAPEESPTPTPVPTDSPSPTSTKTPLGDWVERASNEPEPGHAVNVENNHNADHTIAITVVRESTGTTVYEGTTDLPPETETRVYDTAEANPEGIETFTVTGRLDGERTESVSIRTDSCYGSAYLYVDSDGDFVATYGIC